jgi:hypothetical protein
MATAYNDDIKLLGVQHKTNLWMCGCAKAQGLYAAMLSNERFY